MAYSIELSNLAQEDIGDILAYTLEKWGQKQKEKYQQLIINTIETIRDNPLLGHNRRDIPPIYKAFKLEKHVVVYQIQENTVFIARILHSSMDFSPKVS